MEIILKALKTKLKREIAVHRDLAEGMSNVFDKIDRVVDTESESFNTLILLKSRYHSTRSSYLKGVRREDDYEVSMNRIKYALISTIDSLEEEDVIVKEIEKLVNIPVETKVESTSSSEPIIDSASNKEGLEKTPIKVFISYSWDGEAHQKWVLALADQLVSNGIDVILDQYELTLGKNLNHFMETSVVEVDRVLIIFTENYKLKADRRQGGVGYEYSMMNQELFQNQSDNTKFIPILRQGTSETSIPIFLKSFLYQDMRNDRQFANDFETLLREIYEEPKIKKPPLGKRPKF